MRRGRTRERATSRWLGAGAAIAVLALGIAPAAATAEAPEIALLAGRADSDYERLGLSLRLGPLWSTTWGNWAASIRPELELSRFRYSGPAAGPDALTQGGAIGRLHLHHGAERWRPYAEAGLGVSLFSHDRLGNKAFATHFQFSQHVAVGVELARRGFAGLQYSHYSNADIKDPNDGIDLHQLVVGMSF